MAGNVQSTSSDQEIVNAVINNLSHRCCDKNALQTATSNADTGNEVSVTSELNSPCNTALSALHKQE